MGAPGESELTPQERERYLKKIRQWREMGFETQGLEELLESDFEAFRARRVEILKEQVNGGGVVVEPMDRDIDRKPGTTVDPAVFGIVSPEPQREFRSISTGSRSRPATVSDEPSMVLVGVPSSDDDAGTIVVGRKARPSKKKGPKRPKAEKVGSVTIAPADDDPGSGLDDEYDDDVLTVEEIEEIEDNVDGLYEDEDIGHPSPRPGGAARNGVSVFWVMVIVCMLLGAAAGVYYLMPTDPPQEEEQAISISVSAQTPQAGEKITMEAQHSNGDTVTYSWKLHQDFRFISGTAGSDVISGYFTRPGSYNVLLRGQWPDGSVHDSSATIDVVGLGVSVPERNVPSSYMFRSLGFVDITNPAGIATFTHPEERLNWSIRLDHLHVDYSSSPTDPVRRTLSETDDHYTGLCQVVPCYSDRTDYSMSLMGYARGTLVHKVTGTKHDINATITGSIEYSGESFIDTLHNMVVQTHSTSKGEVKITLNPNLVPDIDIPVDEEYWSFPDPAGGSMNLDIGSLTPDGAFRLGDEGLANVSKTLYSWRATDGYDYVYGKPALNVSFNLKRTDVGDPDSFDMNMYLANGMPEPVRTTVSTRFHDESNRVSMYHFSEMTNDDPGSNPISSLKPTESYTIFSDIRNPGLLDTDDMGISGEFDGDWEILPVSGSLPSVTADLPPDSALATLSTDAAWQTYLQSHSAAYCINGSFDGTSWDLWMAQSGDDQGFHAVVEGDSVTVSETVTVQPPIYSRWQLAESQLTFSGSEAVLARAEKEMDDDRVSELLGSLLDDGIVDTSVAALGIDVDIYFPNPNIAATEPLQYAPYCYVVVSHDGSLQVGVNGESGMVMFMLDHQGGDVPGLSI